MRRKKISIIGALVLGLVMSGCGSVATRLEKDKLNTLTNVSTVTKSISEISGTTTNGTQKASLVVDTNITLSVNPDGNNGKVYNKGAEWRLYQTNSAVVNVSASNNYLISSVTFEFSVSNTGAFLYNSSAITSGTAVSINELSTATFTVGNSGTATNGQVKVTSISVTYGNGSGQQGPVNLTNPDPQFDSDKKEITWTLDTNAEGYKVKIDNGNWIDIEQDVDSYDVSNESAGTHTFTVKAIGNGTTYNTVEGSVNFTIVPPFTAKSYGLCTKQNDLEVGAKYIITNGIDSNIVAMSTETNNNNVRETLVSKDSNGKIQSTYDTLVLELGGSDDAWTFLTTNYTGTNGYFESAATGTSNNLFVKAHDSIDDIPDNGKFTISFNGNVVSIVANAGERTHMRYNAGSNLFSLYASGQNEIYLWKEVTKTVESLTVIGTPSKTTYFVEEQFDPTGITSIVANYSDNSTKDLALTDLSWPVLYLSDHTARGSYTELGTTVYTPNYDVTVQNDSIESLTISGNMTKTAYFTSEQWDKTGLAVTAHYLSGRTLPIDANLYIYSDYEMTNLVERPEDLNQTGSNLKIYIKAEYGLVVSTTPYEQTVSVTVEHGTTAGDPLTATEAFNIGNALANNASTEKYYYIVGVVSEIVDDPAADMEAYGNVTFWIENENDHTARYFEAFRVVPVNAEDVAKLKVGAEVTFCGSIQKYVKDNVTTIETKAGATLFTVTYDEIVLTGITLDATNLCLEVGDEHTFTVSAIPTGAEIGTVTWTSTDEDVVMIDDGYIVAAKEGTATVTARVSDTIYAECNVVVTAPSHKLSSSLFSLDFTTSLPKLDDYSTSCGSVTHNAGGYFVENGTNGTSTAFFTVAGGEPLFGLGSSDIEFKARICRGNVGDTLGNDVKVVLLNMAGEEIEGTDVTVTSTLTTSPEDYTVTVPYNAQAYGIKMYHLKTSGYTVRFYGMEANLKAVSTYATLLADETNTGVENVKIKFGAKISTAAWDEIILKHGEITDYGVMMFKQTRSPDNYSDTPVQDIFKQGLPLNNIHKGDGTPVSTDGENYLFSAKVNITNTANYGVIFCAAPYVIAGGEVYFLGEMQFSVNTLAQYHQANGGSNLSDTALDLLAGTNN